MKETPLSPSGSGEHPLRILRVTGAVKSRPRLDLDQGCRKRFSNQWWA